MRIAIVSKANYTGGGASRFAESLAEWLAREGYAVTHFCGGHRGDLKPFQRDLHDGTFTTKVYRQIHWTTRPFGLNELVPGEYFGSLRKKLASFDVVHYHDLLHTISPVSVALTAASGRQVFFTVHDCTAFTGGCLYPIDCERFRSGCGKCPSLSQFEAKHDFTRFNAWVNRRLAANRKVNYIFPSKWIMDEAQAALKFGAAPRHIPYGIDVEEYGFPSREEARNVLGLPHERRVILISAHDLSDERKGVRYAVEAVEAVRDLNPLVILVGQSNSTIHARLSGIEIIDAGYIASKKTLGSYYAAADVFLFCPLADNLPIAAMEVAAAGTPIVGFRTGGVPEIVGEDAGRFLVPIGATPVLADRLREALTSGGLEMVGRALRKRMRERFSAEACVSEHVQMYRSALEACKAA